MVQRADLTEQPAVAGSSTFRSPNRGPAPSSRGLLGHVVHQSESSGRLCLSGGLAIPG